MNIAEIIQNTRNILTNLGTSINNLARSYPDIFQDPEIKKQLQAFQKSYNEASDRLANPTLSIATLGTTSSGKSTIVNALIGRRIAPIEAGEMSGGVLTLKHKNTTELTINPTQGAFWEVATFLNLTDHQMYDKIQKIMLDYHKSRADKTQKNAQIDAPDITVYGPLLPVLAPDKLGLMSNLLNVEIIDLPGLKSIQDRTNLAVIQQKVNKAFSIVALDYSQVDDQHRKKLLEELKTLVEYLQGRTESMIFILNRVDMRGADDLPLETRIKSLQQEIKETLFLKELPDIIPFCARLLYYAQCAHGPQPYTQSSTTDTDTRLTLLQNMFVDCASIITEKTKKDRDLRTWFRQVQDRIDDEKPLNNDVIPYILIKALEWSGGKELWDCLKKRIGVSFKELVILPALIEVFENYKALESQIQALIQVRRIDGKKEIEKEQKKIEETRKILDEKTNNIFENFNQEITDIINRLKNNDPKEHKRVADEMEKKGAKGFQDLIDIIKEVNDDLTIRLIAPVRDALNNNQPVHELEEKLALVIKPTIAHDIARAYDLTTRKIMEINFSYGTYNLIKKIRANNQTEVSKFEQAQTAMRSLYQNIKNALSARAEFTLQGKAQKLEQALESLMKTQVKSLEELCRTELPSLNIDQAIISNFKQKLSQNPPKLPTDFFKLSNPGNQQRSSQREQTGTRKETKTYTVSEGSCFPTQKTKTRTYNVPTYENIQYIELSLPNPNTMASQWSQGVNQEEKNLWEVIYKWISESIEKVIKVFKQSVNDMLALVDRALSEQLKRIEGNFELQMKRLDQIETQQHLITDIYDQLKKYSTN